MGLSRRQLTALKRNLDTSVVKTRDANGRGLSYLEGWYVLSEANRIFGYDGWSRETTDSRCVLSRENRGSFLAIYIARVRITVQAHGITIIREGSGSGEGRGPSPAEVHDIALKAAETDATKRALATFGKPFGLELYRGDKIGSVANRRPAGSEGTLPAVVSPALQDPVVPPTRTGSHPDDTTPIPRPSRYYGRRQTIPVAEQLRRAEKATDQITSAAPPLAPASAGQPLSPGRIDKSALTIAEPKRLRDKTHLKFVAGEPCLICGRQPCDPHHLRFAQLRAIGMKVSDEFTVPLCRGHHRQLHQAGNEVSWWQNFKIDPLKTAKELWQKTHPNYVAPLASAKEQ